MMRAQSMAGLLACFLLMGCIGTETGNPPLTSEMALTAHSSDPDRVAPVGTPELRVDSAWLALARLEQDPCQMDGEVLNLSGPFAVDLLTGSMPIQTATSDQDYCGVHADLGAATDLPAGAPDEFADQTLLIQGVQTSSGSAVTIRLRREQMVPIKNPTPMPLPFTEEIPLLLSYDMAFWLTGVDLSTATAEADGSILIDLEHNRDLHDVIFRQLQGAAGLYQDLDGDGQLSPAEAANPLATGP